MDGVWKELCNWYNDTVLPSQAENRELGCSFFQTGKTGNLPKTIKIFLHRENFKVLKINVCVVGCCI